MNKQKSKYIYSVKLKAGKTGSAVVVKHSEGYYLLAALHVINQTNTAQIIDINNEVTDIDISNKIESSKDVDICVVKIPDDIAERFVVSAKSASFEVVVILVKSMDFQQMLPINVFVLKMTV